MKSAYETERRIEAYEAVTRRVQVAWSHDVVIDPVAEFNKLLGIEPTETEVTVPPPFGPYRVGDVIPVNRLDVLPDGSVVACDGYTAWTRFDGLWESTVGDHNTDAQMVRALDLPLTILRIGESL